MDKVFVIVPIIITWKCINNLQFYFHDYNIIFVVSTCQEIKQNACY